jgi:hypothetical protein
MGHSVTSSAAQAFNFTQSTNREKMKLRLLAAAIAAIAMTGCTTTTPVKTVMADKDAYLQKNFAVSTARQSVIAQVRAADAGELPFHQMVISTIPHIEASNTTLAVMNPTTTLTYVHDGGPFVMRRDETFSNGILTADNFALTYRGLIALKYQSAVATALNTSLVGEIKEFTSFTPVSGQTPPKSVSLKFTQGNAIQGFNFQTAQMNCTAGELVDASTVNAKFTGLGQKYTCKFINNAGVESETSDHIFLENYGISIVLRRQTSTFTTTFEITNVAVS